MKENKKTLLTQKADFLNRDDFVKSLRRLRQSGGSKQKAADKVLQILGNFALGAEELFKLTNHGESRIQHCVKYELPGACRLVTIQNENAVWFLFVGDHEECDRWIESHEGLTIAAGKSDLRIKQTRVAVPLKETAELQQAGVITDENKPFLERFPFPEFEQLIPQTRLQKDLKSIREETGPTEILEIIELITTTDTRNLIFDLIVAAKDGRYEEAEVRLRVFRGEAESVVKNTELLDSALISGENTDSIITFNDLPPEELTRLLDSERFEDWMLFLHPEQKRIVDEDFEMPAVLKGVSGSGKTVVLIHRARRLAQKYPNEKIGILTLNRSLAELLQLLVDRLCLNGENRNIYVDAYYDYFQKLLNHFGAQEYLETFVEQLPPRHPMVAAVRDALKYHNNLANQFSPKSRETLNDTWREYWRDEVTKDVSADYVKRALIEAIRGEFDAEDYIRDEFTLVRSAFPVAERTSQTGSGYYSYDRKGRTINFPEKVRGLVISLLLRYEEYMFAGAMLDEIGLSQALFPSIKKLQNLPDHLNRRCLLIDEFQDFSTLELRLLKQIPSTQENGLFLTGDTVQKVMVKDFNLGNAALDRNYVRTRTIKKNYRNSKQILVAADALIKAYAELAAKSDDSIERLEPELAVRETAKPIALKSNFPIEAAWEIARDWIVEGQNHAWSVCLVSANPAILPVSRILAKCPDQLKAAELTGKYIEHQDTISVGALSDVKGLEFSLVVVVDCSKAAIPNHQIPEGEHWRDAMRFYVAMTRGRDQVVMTYSGEPSEFLLVMKEHLLWDVSHVEEKPEIKVAVVEPPQITPKIATAHKISLPQSSGFVLSSGADVLLRGYFERKAYRGNSRQLGKTSMDKFNRAFDRWRTPRYLNGIMVSDLFEGREYRKDLADEIDGQLRKFGYRLRWD
jgi:superfamily I DNA/RNA helicase